eukprot:gene31342-6495_t
MPLSGSRCKTRSLVASRHSNSNPHESLLLDVDVPMTTQGDLKSSLARGRQPAGCSWPYIPTRSLTPTAPSNPYVRGTEKATLYAAILGSMRGADVRAKALTAKGSTEVGCNSHGAGPSLAFPRTDSSQLAT